LFPRRRGGPGTCTAPNIPCNGPTTFLKRLFGTGLCGPAAHPVFGARWPSSPSWCCSPNGALVPSGGYAYEWGRGCLPFNRRRTPGAQGHGGVPASCGWWKTPYNRFVVTSAWRSAAPDRWAPTLLVYLTGPALVLIFLALLSVLGCSNALLRRRYNCPHGAAWAGAAHFFGRPPPGCSTPPGNR